MTRSAAPDSYYRYLEAIRFAPSPTKLRSIYRSADAVLGEWIDLANGLHAAHVARKAELAASRYRGDLHGMTLAAPHQYIVCGAVRGLVSSHRTIEAAERALERDRRGCRRQGGYSDASVWQHRSRVEYPVVGGDWVLRSTGGDE